jgi:hypothetical protein
VNEGNKVHPKFTLRGEVVTLMNTLFSLEEHRGEERLFTLGESFTSML